MSDFGGDFDDQFDNDDDDGFDEFGQENQNFDDDDEDNVQDEAHFQNEEQKNVSQVENLLQQQERKNGQNKTILLIGKSTNKKIPNDQRQTSKYMTKYQKARIIGTRALQISKNAPILVDPPKGVSDPLEIAAQELREKKLPFIVRRNLPGGYHEDWKVEELVVD